MLVYALRRILYTVPIALGVSLVCFALIHLAPGDPLSAVLPEGASPEMIAQVRNGLRLRTARSRSSSSDGCRTSSRAISASPSSADGRFSRR